MDFREHLKQREVFLKKLLQELPGEWAYTGPAEDVQLTS